MKALPKDIPQVKDAIGEAEQVLASRANRS
jgi:hypothetical protein